jgi:hypothetical protein
MADKTTPEKTPAAKKAAPDIITTITDALAAVGITDASVRRSNGVHDTVILISIPKE